MPSRRRGADAAVSPVELLWRLQDAVAARTDPLARHRRRLRHSAGSVRRGAVATALLAGASAVLLPYHGLGLPDAGWLGLTAGAATWTVFAVRAHRQLARAVPLPAPARGSAARPASDRLVAARRVLQGLLARLGPLAGDVAGDAAAGERALLEQAARIAALEAALAVAPGEAVAGLVEARRVLLAGLDAGVAAYERLVAAAAECLAVAGGAGGGASTAVGDPSAVRRLADAADALAGVTTGLVELRGRHVLAVPGSGIGSGIGPGGPGGSVA